MQPPGEQGRVRGAAPSVILCYLLLCFDKSIIPEKLTVSSNLCFVELNWCGARTKHGGNGFVGAAASILRNSNALLMLQICKTSVAVVNS